MNWGSALYDLYQKNEAIAGKFEDLNEQGNREPMLLPPSHTTVLAQIEVTINLEGEFLRARSLSKVEALTLIPVSEASAIRTSNPVPHPLMDKLVYIAGDYERYVPPPPDKKEKAKPPRALYDEYIKTLEGWCSSEYSHLKAVTILTYLKKARLMEDLVREKVLLTDEGGFVSENVKIQNVVQTDAFVRFCIQAEVTPSWSDDTGRYAAEIWKDTTLQKSCCEYLSKQSRTTGLCYLSGRVGRTTTSYPKKIRNEGDGTKLLSSNDNEGYTFRGRFQNSGEAFSIGYDASQKVHSALKWIIRKQGYNRDGLCVATWESDLKPCVSVFDDAAGIVNRAEDEDDLTAPEPLKPDTNPITAAQLKRALKGYKEAFGNETSYMVVMALDAATPGRLSMTYYNRLPSSRYLENIAFWHETCEWRHVKFINKHLVPFDGMPSLHDIAITLYGTEQNQFLKLKTDSNGKAPMLVSTFQRLIPCMLERKRIPRDMERLAILRASSPMAYENYNWRKILAVACSLVKKSRHDWKGEKWDMALDHNCKDRSYLYGRLLAVADLVEGATFEAGEKRETNAMRYMNAFSKRPFRTWKIIEERLPPYFNKLQPGYRVHFKKLLNEIQDLFISTDDFKIDTSLDGLYLLGYHCQISEHYSQKDEQHENKTGGDEA